MNISLVKSNLPYNVQEGSENFGRTYNRYAVDGVAFVSGSDSDFATRFTNDEPLHSVTFGVNDDGQYSLIGFITAKKFDAHHKATSNVKARETAILSGNLEALAAL